MAQVPQTNFVLRHSAGRMPCKPKSGTFSLREKSGFSPSAPPPIFPRSGNSLIWLANNVRETNLFSSFGFIWIKKGDTEDFRLQQTATKFGANIIWLLVYLFAKNFCL